MRRSLPPRGPAQTVHYHVRVGARCRIAAIKIISFIFSMFIPFFLFIFFKMCDLDLVQDVIVLRNAGEQLLQDKFVVCNRNNFEYPNQSHILQSSTVG